MSCGMVLIESGLSRAASFLTLAYAGLTFPNDFCCPCPAVPLGSANNNGKKKKNGMLAVALGTVTTSG